VGTVQMPILGFGVDARPAVETWLRQNGLDR
jgi:hypothetical protein